MLKKLLSTVLIIGLAINLIAVPVNAESSPTVNRQNTVSQENKQIYTTEEGKQHTIYWAQGINPPKMTGKSDEFGTDGFFEKEVLNVKPQFGEPYTEITYQAPMEEGKGYYDLNKNIELRPEEHLCYLGVAMNLLHWWLDRNSSYIDTYLDRLKNTDIYSQPKGLKNILPFDKTLWDNVRKKPLIHDTGNGRLAQELYYDSLTKTFMGMYYRRDDGYFSDLVLDFFINGYLSERKNPEDLNNEDNFVKDSLGGFFHPIFGKKIITQRKHTSLYSYYNDNIADLLKTGHGIGISYYFAGGRMAHIITLWGAEYDEKGNLCRVYVTDSDDYNNTTVNKPDTSRGIHSMGVVKGEDGLIYLTNKVGANKGTLVQSLTTLSLAQDIWESALNDTSAADEPLIEEEPEDQIYAVGAKAEPLTVKANTTDRGYLVYQWYKKDSLNGPSQLIEGADKASFVPSASAQGIQYYYCEVGNIKNGRKTVKNTRTVKFEVQNIPLVNAQTPVLKFNYYTVNPSHYSGNYRIYADASVKDGGELKYQWYRAINSYAENGTLMKGENKPYIDVSTHNAGKSFYYCIVTNYNKNATGNRRASVKPQFSKCINISALSNIKKGDSNNDSNINADDLIYLQKHLIGSVDFYNINRANSDLNNDGKNDILDLVLIKKAFIG